MYLKIFIVVVFGLFVIFLLMNFRAYSPLVQERPIVQNGSGKKNNALQYFSQRLAMSIDDDPILGNKNAPLTLIEFSDFECGNCKLFFQKTLPRLKENYINQGKLRLVYRDFPGPSHEPLATKEALAANCSREQGGDSKYFEYHDRIFMTTKSGGKGLNVDDLFSIANNLKLDQELFKDCFESERFKEEIKKDFFDGMNGGITGTPTFFLGLTTQNNTINGIKISGAMPYQAFKIIIEELLKSNEKNN